MKEDSFFSTQYKNRMTKTGDQLENVNNAIVISILKNNLKTYVHERNKGYRKNKRRFCLVFSSQSNGIILILGIYIVIFLIACVILVTSVLRLETDDENKFQFYYKFSNASDRIVNHLASAHLDNVFSSKLFKEFIWPYKNSKKHFNCSALSYIKKFTHISSGWTKSVFSFEYNNQNFALKTLNVNGKDITNCSEKNPLRKCYEKASSKIYKEYILSRELSHSNIVKVLGWCVGDDSALDNVAIITELCSPVDTVMFLQMSFRQRLEVSIACREQNSLVLADLVLLLQVVYELAKLVAYLSASPLGSVAINDFRRQQFVLCNGVLKLTDLDDLSIEEPRCLENEHCSQDKLVKGLGLSGNRTDEKMKCAEHVCRGYNQKQNVMNMYKHFVSLFLPINVPDLLKKDVRMLLASYLASDWDSEIVLQKTKDLYLKFNNSNIKSY